MLNNPIDVLGDCFLPIVGQTAPLEQPAADDLGGLLLRGQDHRLAEAVERFLNRL